jgi:glutamyl-Q tRNA(Asp) synthetase
MSPPIVTRFAPSPTGSLHLGHAYAALFAWRAAQAAGGHFLLRIEDIDPQRCRPEHDAALLEDLAWLGLSWPEPVRRQSQHMDDYARALDRLSALGVLYPCFCSRKDIAEEIARSAAAPHLKEERGVIGEGPLYPGLCRRIDPTIAWRRAQAGEPCAFRLDTAKAAALVGPLQWCDRAQGLVDVIPDLLGDAVLARRDARASYHLSVVVDDALQGITLVTRGKDLFHATHLHRLLQALLGLPVPLYHHHDLLLNADGQRLSKRDGAATLRSLRQEGTEPAAIWRMVGFGDTCMADTTG